MAQTNSISLKTRIITILLCLLVPLVLALNAYAIYINASFTSRIAELNEVSLAGYVERVAETLATAENTMSDFVGSSNEFRGLAREVAPLAAYDYAYSVFTQMKSAVTSQNNISAMVLYNPVNSMFMPAWGSVELTRQEAIRRYLSGWQEAEWQELPGRWKLLELADSYYLCRMVHYLDAVYMFAFVGLEELALTGEQHVAFAVEGSYLTSRALAEENRLPVPDTQGGYATAGVPNRYLLMAHSVRDTQVDAVYMIPSEDIYTGVGPFQLVLLLISLFAIALVPLGYWWMSRALFRPMDDLVGAMETAATGDLTVRASSEYRDREFRSMGDTFNSMLGQIQDLKIESYERELDARQAQLSFLQLQIRPHFYLNCMKNLYGMAQAEQYDDIQEMLVVLSNYLRYMMGSNTEWVTLEEELQNSRNYIRLQQLNQAYPPECNISVDTNALGVRIPPITLLTFVENCVKHAEPESQLVINLRARLLAAEEGLLLLSIHDNGRGFAPERLEGLNKLNEELLDTESVGINNVWQRLKLLYGERCGIVFSNDNGALVEIFLPVKDDHRDDTADS